MKGKVPPCPAAGPIAKARKKNILYNGDRPHVDRPTWFSYNSGVWCNCTSEASRRHKQPTSNPRCYRPQDCASRHSKCTPTYEQVTAAVLAGPCIKHAMANGPVEPWVLHACRASTPILLHVCNSKKLCSQDGVGIGSASACKWDGSTTSILAMKGCCPQAGARCTSMRGRCDTHNCVHSLQVSKFADVQAALVALKEND